MAKGYLNTDTGKFEAKVREGVETPEDVPAPFFHSTEGDVLMYITAHGDHEITEAHTTTEDLSRKISRLKWATILLSVVVLILAVVAIVLTVQLNAPEPPNCDQWETGSFDYFYCIETGR
jgi:hypothetical protein